MFATKDINKFFDIDIAMSNDMVNSIDLWNKILENKQPWLSKKKVLNHWHWHKELAKNFLKHQQEN